MNEQIVAEWIAQESPFVCYRLPERQVCQGIRQVRGKPLRIENIAGLNGRKGFVFAPFCPEGEYPLWLLQPDEEVRLTLADDEEVLKAPAEVPLCGDLCTNPSVGYSACFHSFSSVLCDGTFRKLVLSRSQTIPKPDGFSLAEAFFAACRRYVHSYVYLFYTPETGYWIGATPEILLSGRGVDYRTVALAGTQFLKNGKLTEEWTEKNIREQHYVTAYIDQCLRQRGITACLRGPFTITAGVLAHLTTELTFSLSSSQALGDLLEALHPTPAVCGLPKQEAYHFIRMHEGYSRGYYSGFLGWLDPEGNTDLYVNLRCMQIKSSGINLFAGGGLLAESVLEDEWMETEKKMQTMKYVIQKGASHVYR